ITASSDGGGSTTQQIERALPIKQIPTVELQLMNSGTLPIQSSAADHVEKASAMDPVDDSLTSKTPIAPDLPLPDTDGISNRVSEFTASGPAVLVYARGAHCPFCLRQLSDYADRYSEFKRAGVEVVALSPESQRKSRRLRTGLKLPFTVLSDSKLEAARAFGLI